MITARHHGIYPTNNAIWFSFDKQDVGSSVCQADCAAFICSWVCGVDWDARKRGNSTQCLSFPFLSLVRCRKSSTLGTSVFAACFQLKFVLFHLETPPPLPSVQIRDQVKLREDCGVTPPFPQVTSGSLRHGEERHYGTQLYIESGVCTCIMFPSIPIVNTTKMMTATPSSIAIQLSTIDRRPYFLAPAISPVWRTDLD